VGLSLSHQPFDTVGLALEKTRMLKDVHDTKACAHNLGVRVTTIRLSRHHRRGTTGHTQPHVNTPKDHAGRCPRVDADGAAAPTLSGEDRYPVAPTAGGRCRSSATLWPRLPDADAGGASGTGRRASLWVAGAPPSLRRMPAMSVPPSRALFLVCRPAGGASARCAPRGSGAAGQDAAGVGRYPRRSAETIPLADRQLGGRASALYTPTRATPGAALPGWRSAPPTSHSRGENPPEGSPSRRTSPHRGSWEPGADRCQAPARRVDACG